MSIFKCILFNLALIIVIFIFNCNYEKCDKKKDYFSSVMQNQINNTKNNYEINESNNNEKFKIRTQ